MRIIVFIIILVVIGFIAYTNAKEKTISQYMKRKHEDK